MQIKFHCLKQEINKKYNIIDLIFLFLQEITWLLSNIVI